MFCWLQFMIFMKQKEKQENKQELQLELEIKAGNKVSKGLENIDINGPQ